MNTDPHIVWKGLTSSPALEARIREELTHLEKACDRITACRVVLERPHRHTRQGSSFGVNIEVTVPGRVLAVSRHPDARGEAHDGWAAVNEAFGTMRRQIDDYVRKRRGE